MEGPVKGGIYRSHEFIEASLSVAESSFQLELKLCGISGLKYNVTKIDQGVAEGMVLDIETGRSAQSHEVADKEKAKRARARDHNEVEK